MAPGGAAGEAGGKQVLGAFAQQRGEWVFAEFAVKLGVGGGGVLQVAADGFFDGGQAAAGAFDLFFKGFFAARQFVFADKGAVADGGGEVVAQGVGGDVFEQHGGLGEALDAFAEVFHVLFELQLHEGDHALAVGLFGGFRGVEQAQGYVAVFFLLQAEVAGELLFAAGEFDGFGQGADVPVGNMVALEFLGVVAEGNGGGLAEAVLQLG